MQERRTRPATAADFHRLADLAQERGLRVFEGGSNQWFCTSHSDPFALHTVTGFSCDCRGFLHHQRCTHHAALLAHLGWLPELESETPAEVLPDSSKTAPQQCFWCCGSGRIPNDQHERYDRCEPCGGTGVRKSSPAVRPHGQPAVEIVAAAA
jgi:hypothetical protein